MEDLVILEASDRIGGRVRKEDFGGVSVELGAGWVAGVGGKESNPVWELARKSGLRTCYSDYSNARYNIYDRRFVFKVWSLCGYSSWNWFWNMVFRGISWFFCSNTLVFQWKNISERSRGGLLQEGGWISYSDDQAAGSQPSWRRRDWWRWLVQANWIASVCSCLIILSPSSYAISISPPQIKAYFIACYFCFLFQWPQNTYRAGHWFHPTWFRDGRLVLVHFSSHFGRNFCLLS